MNITLTPKLKALIQSKINTGMYTNASEVIRDALRKMDTYDEWKPLNDLLKTRLEAVERGEVSTQSFDEIIDEAEVEWEAKNQEKRKK